MNDTARVIIKPRRARPFYARHPWVLSNSIERVEGSPEPGAEVIVLSHERKFIAQGLWNPNSTIQARLYRWEEAPLDEAFWLDRVDSALRLRSTLPGNRGDRSARRLIYSEADGLSGLTVDQFDQYLVMQFTSLALHQRKDLFIKALTDRLSPAGIMLRTERGIAKREGLEIDDGVVHGTIPDEPIAIVEHALEFRVDLRTGQKTGFYLDQRENRLAASTYAFERNVLDVFCYTGGFGVAALKLGGAASCLGIDGSTTAIDLARVNAERNGVAQASFEHADAFDALERFRIDGRKFNMIICDPPKFARSPNGIEEALKGYLRLNRAAVAVLERDGILVTCSCSGLIDRGLFVEVIAQVAEQSGRAIQILEQRGQAPDHPVSASCLDTEYLKCLICRVE